VPDSETDLMMLAISPRTILLQSSGFAGSGSELDRCWTEVTQLALAYLPKLYVPATEAFAGAPASWYLEPEAPTANEASPADADESDLIAPSEDDRKVVEAALLRLMDDPDFDTFPGFKSGPLVLNPRTPKATGGLNRAQVLGDLRKQHNVPDEMIDALMVRNEEPGSTTYRTRRASWAGLSFDSRIVVADLEPLEKAQRDSTFQDTWPAARAWVEAYLPAYSADGSQAIVRAFFGPTPHGSSYTAWLAKSGDTWVVVWESIAYYA